MSDKLRTTWLKKESSLNEDKMMVEQDIQMKKQIDNQNKIKKILKMDEYKNQVEK